MSVTTSPFALHLILSGKDERPWSIHSYCRDLLCLFLCFIVKHELLLANGDDHKKCGVFSGPLIIHSKERKVLPIFDNLVHNGTKDDLEAEFLGSQYVIPRESCFYMVCCLANSYSTLGSAITFP